MTFAEFRVRFAEAGFETLDCGDQGWAVVIGETRPCLFFDPKDGFYDQQQGVKYLPNVQKARDMLDEMVKGIKPETQ